MTDRFSFDHETTPRDYDWGIVSCTECTMGLLIGLEQTPDAFTLTEPGHGFVTDAQATDRDWAMTDYAWATLPCPYCDMEFTVGVYDPEQTIADPARTDDGDADAGPVEFAMLAEPGRDDPAADTDDE